MMKQIVSINDSFHQQVYFLSEILEGQLFYLYQEKGFFHKHYLVASVTKFLMNCRSIIDQFYLKDVFQKFIKKAQDSS